MALINKSPKAENTVGDVFLQLRMFYAKKFDL